MDPVLLFTQPSFINNTHGQYHIQCAHISPTFLGYPSRCRRPRLPTHSLTPIHTRKYRVTV